MRDPTRDTDTAFAEWRELTEEIERRTRELGLPHEGEITWRGRPYMLSASQSGWSLVPLTDEPVV